MDAPLLTETVIYQMTYLTQVIRRYLQPWEDSL